MSTVQPRVRTYWLADEPGAILVQRRQRARSAGRARGSGVSAQDDGVHIRVLHGTWEDARSTLAAHGEASDAGSPSVSLAPSPALLNVRALHLIACNLTWAHIAQLPRMPCLTTLDVSDNALEAVLEDSEPGGVDALLPPLPNDAIALCAPAATSVSLQGCGLTLLPILPPTVCVLNLAYNQLTDVAGIERQAAALTHLQLQGNNISKTRVLMSLACLGHLQELNLHPNPVTLLLPTSEVHKQLVFCLSLTHVDEQPFSKRDVYGSRRGAAKLRARTTAAVTGPLSKTIACLQSPRHDMTAYISRTPRVEAASRDETVMPAPATESPPMSAADRTARIHAQRASVAALSSPPSFMKRLMMSSTLPAPHLPPRATPISATVPSLSDAPTASTDVESKREGVDGGSGSGTEPPELQLQDLTTTRPPPPLRQSRKLTAPSTGDVNELRFATAAAAVRTSLEMLQQLAQASTPDAQEAPWAQLGYIQARASKLGLLMLPHEEAGVTLAAARAVSTAALSTLRDAPSGLPAMQVCLQACMTFAVLLRAQTLLSISTATAVSGDHRDAEGACAHFIEQTRKGMRSINETTH